MLMLMTLQTALGDKRPIDDQLLLQVAAGHPEAFRTLYDRAHKPVYAFALTITQNTHDAEDVLQDTFLKVYEKAGTYVPQGKPMAWIFTIARHLALSRRRQEGKTEELEDTVAAMDFSEIEQVDSRLLLQTLFRCLRPEEKQIVVLHAVSGLKHREVAATMQMPLSTVLSKYHRAMQKLQNELKKEGWS